MKTTVTRTRHRAAAALAVALVVGLLACPASADDAPFTVDDGRIVGGQEVDPPGKYAFMVALVDSGSDSYYGQFCGAALIGPTWVLTAAHCVVGESAGDIDVVIGRHDLKGTEGERIGVGSITVHPGYNDRTTVNDIAVLKLESASSYGTVSLPSGGGLDTAGRIVTITGWGDTESIPRFPSKLQQVTVPIVSNADCAGAYGNEFKASSMLCAGDLPDGGEDSCEGDSGGPLFVADGDGWIQLGIVSWGYGCADAGNPGVYSRVSALQPWVTSVTGVQPGEGGSGGGGGGGGGAAPTCGGRTATIWGTSGADTLDGTTGPDVIAGLGGDDTINGLGSDDLICGGDGDDILEGGVGADTMYGGDGNDRLNGASGGDFLYGEAGADWIVAGPGRDYAEGGLGKDRILGGGDSDELHGGPGRDVLRGGRRGDALHGDGGNDRLVGGWGLDTGTGGAGIDFCETESTQTCES